MAGLKPCHICLIKNPHQKTFAVAFAFYLQLPLLFSSAVTFAFLSVIPEGNLLLFRLSPKSRNS
jgi:hypothetical protein